MTSVSGNSLTAVPRRMFRSQRRAALTLLVIAGGWELLSLALPPYLIPGWEILVPDLRVALTESGTYHQIWITLVRIVVSLTASVVLGVLVGAIMGLSPRGEAYLTPFVRFVSGVPALTWILVAVIWFSGAEVRIFFVIVAITIPILSVNTLAGIKQLSPELNAMIYSLRPSFVQRMRILVAPHTAPHIVAGSRVALSFATRLVVFAELIAATSGIGARMYAAYATFDIASIFVWTIFLVVVLYGLDALLSVAERRLARWQGTTTRTT